MSSSELPPATSRSATLPVAEWVAAAAWMLVGIGTLVASIPLESFTRFGPGPGFFLRGLAAVLIGLAVLKATGLVRAAMTGRSREGLVGAEGRRIEPWNALRFVSLSGALLGYALLLEWLGFLAATTALCWATLVILHRPPLRAFLESLVAAVLVRTAFSTLLGVPLPTSQIELLRLLDW
jgi:Tripartite tricarboxylate transporter TctB family